MSSPTANLYKIRVFQPGYGPKIVVCLLSDLGDVDSGGMPSQNILFPITGSPTSSTLPAGNYSGSIPGSGYLAGDVAATGSSLWICTTAGSNQVGSPGGSAWSQVSGGGSAQWLLWINQAIPAGTTIRVASSGTYGNVTTTPGTYICVVSTPGGANGLTAAGDPGFNQIPQYPEPASGTVYFRLIALGPQLFGVCSPGGSENVYVNSSAPL